MKNKKSVIFIVTTSSSSLHKRIKGLSQDYLFHCKCFKVFFSCVKMIPHHWGESIGGIYVYIKLILSGFSPTRKMKKKKNVRHGLYYTRSCVLFTPIYNVLIYNYRYTICTFKHKHIVVIFFF